MNVVPPSHSAAPTSGGRSRNHLHAGSLGNDVSPQAEGEWKLQFERRSPLCRSHQWRRRSPMPTIRESNRLSSTRLPGKRG
jgi:hypothetical protein